MTATYDCIATTTLTSAASTVTFSSISSTYTDIRAIISATSTSSSYVIASVRFNNDSGTNYSFIQTGVRFPGGTATFASTRDDNVSYIWGPFIRIENGSGGIFDIFDYSNTTTFKVVWESSISWTGETEPYPVYNCGVWENTSAITTITFVNGGGPGTQFDSGSTFALYGIKKE